MRASAALLSLLLPLAALGAPAAEVPDALRGWEAWVLHGHEAETCPALPTESGMLCAWPSRLEVTVGDDGGRFRQEWEVRARSLVALPGDEHLRPLDIRVDGRGAAVLGTEAPDTWLDPGSHVITGTFEWDAMPESLPVPRETGLVALTLRGASVAIPTRDASGRLWLAARNVEATEADALSMAVHRLVVDDAPMLVTTRLLLEVAGRAREVVLGPALPAGAIPVSLDTPLPARLEPDGALRIQLRAGSWTIVIVSRQPGPVAELAPPQPNGDWAPDEVWCFQAMPSLRVVTVSGPPQLDPRQAQLPPEWTSLPTFRVGREDVMRFEQRRRGDEEAEPDHLTLQRHLWLDFDGGGITASDVMSGSLHRSWRMEMAEPWVLGRASANGDDRFLTRVAGSSAAGIEVREGMLMLQADSRLEGRARTIPAVGWRSDVDGLSVQLSVPPGWRLVHAHGADAVSGSWMDAWTLLDLFLVLVVAAAALRIFGVAAGVLALVTLTLAMPEVGAPRWSWLVALVLVAVIGLLPERLGFRKVLRGAHVVVMLIIAVIAVPFLLQQSRQALFPQLENTATIPSVRFDRDESQEYLADIPAEASPSASLDNGVEAKGGRQRMYHLDNVAPATPLANAVPAPASGEPAQLVLHDPRDVVQTGPGIPTWQWREHQIAWKGPVKQDQVLRLLLLPPSITRLLSVLRVLLVLLLLVRVALPPAVTLRSLVARLRPHAPAAAGALVAVPPALKLRDLVARLRPRAPGLAAGAVVAVISLLATSPCFAQTPPPEMLDELRQRLLERAPCHPDCASLGRLFVEVDTSSLRLRLEVAAEAESVVALPGGASWAPARVMIDGHAATLLRDGSENLWLLVEAGAHDVTLEGPLPDRDILALPLPTPPARVDVRASGWSVSGVHDGRADGALQLQREARATTGAKPSLAPGALPPFLRLTRRLDLGLTWEVTSTLEALAPATVPALLRIPLLPGENVTTAGMRVEDGHAIATLAPGQASLSWRSTITPTDSLKLKAPDTNEWQEEWQLAVSPLWHVEVSGIAPLHAEAIGEIRERAWRPWPGEEITLASARPEAVSGATLTIDRSTLALVPGKRATDATLALSLRSSRGGEHVVTLPEGAELLSFSLDSVPQPLRQEQRAVVIPLRPGVIPVVLQWREPRGMRSAFRTSDVDLGAPSVNAYVQVGVPQDRWLLWTSGPRMGPAVLFWPLLMLLVLLAGLLRRLRLTPLSLLDWVLLMIGLSQVPAWIGSIAVAWLLLLGLRRARGSDVSPVLFDILQIVLALGSLATILVLFIAIQQGLLGRPDMQVAGPDSNGSSLTWMQDRSVGPSPVAHVISAPMLAYRIAMLLWALWLAAALVRWARWAWESFTHDGAWKRPPRRPAKHPAAPVPAP
jgi:hypothetical protein